MLLSDVPLHGRPLSIIKISAYIINGIEISSFGAPYMTPGGIFEIKPVLQTHQELLMDILQAKRFEEEENSSIHVFEPLQFICTFLKRFSSCKLETWSREMRSRKCIIALFSWHRLLRHILSPVRYSVCVLYDSNRRLNIANNF